MKFGRSTVWLTYGRGIKRYGLLLVGGHWDRHDNEHTGKLDFRGYVGTNDYKLVFGGQYGIDVLSDKRKWRGLIETGLEARLRQSVWFVVSVNGRRVDEKNEMTASANLKVGLTNLRQSLESSSK